MQRQFVTAYRRTCHVDGHIIFYSQQLGRATLQWSRLNRVNPSQLLNEVAPRLARKRMRQSNVEDLSVLDLEFGLLLMEEVI